MVPNKDMERPACFGVAGENDFSAIPPTPVWNHRRKLESNARRLNDDTNKGVAAILRTRCVGRSQFDVSGLGMFILDMLLLRHGSSPCRNPPIRRSAAVVARRRNGLGCIIGYTRQESHDMPKVAIRAMSCLCAPFFSSPGVDFFYDETNPDRRFQWF